MLQDEIQNHGFIPSEIIEEEHYILGDSCLVSDVLMPDSHGWKEFLPAFEPQSRNGLETMNCSNYGTLHALAALGKRKFGFAFQQNLSERYTGVMTGTGKGGNDPHNVIEIIRKTCGVIPEAFLPYNDSIETWEEYYSPLPMTSDFLAIGKHWLGKYIVGHDWVFRSTDSLVTKQISLKEALKFSPIGISVYAWSQHADGLYYKAGIDNHWVCLFDYVEGQYWLIFDTYDASIKKLDWYFNFGQAKRYSLKLNTGSETTGFWGAVKDFLGNIFK